MTLTKKKMVREIGRRTRLTNRKVQGVVEALIDVWTEALIEGKRIEIENFVVLEVIEIDRGSNNSFLIGVGNPPQIIRKISLRASRKLKQDVNSKS